jgi:hypothetical protein
MSRIIDALILAVLFVGGSYLAGYAYLGSIRAAVLMILN